MKETEKTLLTFKSEFKCIMLVLKIHFLLTYYVGIFVSKATEKRNLDSQIYITFFATINYHILSIFWKHTYLIYFHVTTVQKSICYSDSMINGLQVDYSCRDSVY